MLRKLLAPLVSFMLMVHNDETGAIAIASAEEIARKWKEVTPGRASYYEAGAVVAGDEWEKGTKAGADAYLSAVTAANIKQLFLGGVGRAGAGKYERKVKDVGVGRFSTGVQAAETDMREGFAPFREVIAGVTLTKRQPRGSLANWERSKEIGVPLNKKRLALRAAGA